MISLERWIILTSLQKLSSNVGDLAKLIVAISFEWLPKLKKSPNLVTLEPGSSGNRRLMRKKSWDQIPSLDAGCTFFTTIYRNICRACLKGPKINKKRPVWLTCAKNVLFDSWRSGITGIGRLIEERHTEAIFAVDGVGEAQVTDVDEVVVGQTLAKRSKIFK